jgi:hypothetical protein
VISKVRGELQKGRAAAVAEEAQAVQEGFGFGPGVAQPELVGDDFGKFEAELEARRGPVAPALDGGLIGDGVESRVAFHGVEAAAVEREEVALFRARREEVPHPAFQPPDGTTQVEGHCKSRMAVIAGRVA